MAQKIFFTLLLLFTVTACGTSNLGSKIRKVEIGMTKKEVVSILGNSQDILRAVQTPEGTLEVWKYTHALSADMYILHFLDNKLVEWFKEIDPAKLNNANNNGAN